MNILCTSSGPGSASLAASWSATHSLTTVHVWGDTTDYMYTNFCSVAPIGGNYPSAMVINLETMELTYLELSGVASTESAIQAIIDGADECADI